MPQLAPVNWLLLFLIFWSAIFLTSILIWWFIQPSIYMHPVGKSYISPSSSNQPDNNSDLPYEVALTPSVQITHLDENQKTTKSLINISNDPGLEYPTKSSRSARPAVWFWDTMNLDKLKNPKQPIKDLKTKNKSKT